MNEELFAFVATDDPDDPDDPDEEQDQAQPIPELEAFDEEELADIFNRLEHGA
ncbi:hypothetical protein [Candidatus Chloroploca asiatica]|uniref:hypothetical protein n=1 Tax=Candidatus Chloroploca asiatica TaxID=1506545 RepID=UPI0015586A32|nr:hypothetical protein [Candidatus Chloroploca asiatica]